MEPTKRKVFGGFVDVTVEKNKIVSQSTELLHKTLDKCKTIEEAIQFYRAFEAGYIIRPVPNTERFIVDDLLSSASEFNAYRAVISAILKHIDYLIHKRGPHAKKKTNR